VENGVKIHLSVNDHDYGDLTIYAGEGITSDEIHTYTYSRDYGITGDATYTLIYKLYPLDPETREGWEYGQTDPS
jgi:hypothetical protein